MSQRLPESSLIIWTLGTPPSAGRPSVNNIIYGMGQGILYLYYSCIDGIEAASLVSHARACRVYGRIALVGKL